MKLFRTLSLLLFVFFISVISNGQSLTDELNTILEKAYPADQPGATVLIAKNGEVLYRNAFGMANLELNVPMKPENVFEIGSITKQFTVVAILMLQEQGKLEVTDALTKYIPDYPTQGETITIHHLLNHTSGIKSYTSMPSFRSQARTDMTPTELIDVFKNEPMDFKPGEQYAYNNSAYIILGHIIELVSGKSYAAFIEENIFKPLGMNNSYYGDKSKIIEHRASGYQPGDAGYRNADYLSMTLPYAGGSLMSCVDDMLLWSQAVHNNTLISEESKQLAFTEGKLQDNSRIYYGYGWSIDTIGEYATIEHGGGIFGYTTYGIYVPSTNVYTIVLTNSNGANPRDVTVKIAAKALGVPYVTTAKNTAVAAHEMEKWVGTYEFEDGAIRTISLVDGLLYSQREGSETLPLIPIANNEYGFDDSLTKYVFEMEEGKRVANFSARIRKSKGVETTKIPQAEKKSISVDTNILEAYVGTYELQPGFDIVITVTNGTIYAQATGQSQFQIFPESETRFFLKVVPAEIEFSVDEAGNVSHLTLFQGGNEMKGNKKG